MKVGLFIPCYINQYYPNVAIATYKLLKHLNLDVKYPLEQTCCGQPLANSGYERYTKNGIEHFIKIFKDFDIIISPSGSCVLFVKEHPLFKNIANPRIMELSEFLVENKSMNQISISYPKNVGVLQSCHGLRGLHLGKPSELMENGESTIIRILEKVRDIKLVKSDRLDECCGFGGTFSIKEPELSVKMGHDRISGFIKNGAEILTGTDVSCLMHLEGIIRKRKLRLEVKHFSEILMPV